MRLRDGFCFKKIENDTYLLPYGQAVAEFSRGMKLNASGEFIAFLLTLNLSKDKILEKMRDKYGASDEDMPILEKDLDDFLNHLKSMGVLIEDEEINRDYIKNQSEEAVFNIAGFSLRYHGPLSLLRKEMSAFAADPAPENADANYDQEICIVMGMPGSYPIGNLLLRTPELSVIENDNIYAFIYSRNNHVNEMHVSKDASSVFIYSEKRAANSTGQYSEAEEIFFAMRTAFFILAQQNGLCAIHSSSILYNGKAILFSGPSGAGKSTHAALWKKAFDVAYINGDLNLIGCDKDTGEATVYGLPWCGTSDIYNAGSWPLGAIVLLDHGIKNLVHRLSGSEMILSISQRMISPTWTENLFSSNIKTASDVCALVPVLRYACTKKPEAARILKGVLDKEG